MKEIMDFMQRLAVNNEKPWFDTHKTEYKAIKEKFDAFALEFMHGVEEFDKRVHGLGIKDITYRIYRDIRFSPDKRPYKDWMGVYVCPKGKKSGMAGYYIHMEPVNNLYFICAGLYNPTKEVLKSVREEIMLEPEGFHQAVKKCGEGFRLSWENALKKIPKEYVEECEQGSQVKGKGSRVQAQNLDDDGNVENAGNAGSNTTLLDYLRLKDYSILKPVTKREMLGKDFLKNALSDLRNCLEFNELLNNCFDYAYDEERE